jgi:hypothetical protein
LYNFPRIPIVLSDPYRYGEENAPPVADLGVDEPSMVVRVGSASAEGGDS